MGYIRVSTDTQNNGLEVQKSAIETYVLAMKFLQWNFYIDEGVSGGSDKREALSCLLNDLKKDDIVIVQKRDRLGREPFMAYMTEKIINEKGSKLISLAGEGSGSDDPSSILMRRMIDAFSEHERSIIRERTKAVLRSKKERNERIGHIPFGKKLSLDKIHLEPNESEILTLQKMVSLRDKGVSCTKIVKILNSCSPQTLNRGKPWDDSNIDKILRNRYGYIRKPYKKK